MAAKNPIPQSIIDALETTACVLETGSGKAKSLSDREAWKVGAYGSGWIFRLIIEGKWELARTLAMYYLVLSHGFDKGRPDPDRDGLYWRLLSAGLFEEYEMMVEILGEPRSMNSLIFNLIRGPTPVCGAPIADSGAFVKALEYLKDSGTPIEKYHHQHHKSDDAQMAEFLATL